MNKTRKKRNVHRRVDIFALHLTDTNNNDTLVRVRWTTTKVKPNFTRLMRCVGKDEEFDNHLVGIKSISKI